LSQAPRHAPRRLRSLI